LSVVKVKGLRRSSPSPPATAATIRRQSLAKTRSREVALITLLELRTEAR